MTGRRADFLIECGPSFGMGHLSRSLVLARALAARGAQIRFAATTDDCAGRIGEFPAAAEPDAPQAEDLLIVDGYRIPADLIARRAAPALATVLLDDTGDRPRPCDAVVNFMLYGESCDYSAYPAKTRLLGPKYAPIRPAFAALRADNDRSAPRVLASFGGGTTSLIGLEAARALARRFSGPIDVVLGGGAQADEPGAPNITLHRNTDMVALMGQATLYMGALGTTFLEALAAGLPAVTAVVAPDQIRVAKAAKEMGVPTLDDPNPEAIADAALAALEGGLAPAAPDYPDGKGADRLADAILALAA